MNRLLIALAASTALASAQPALAQDHSQHQGMNMPGMQMPAPAKKPAKKPAPKKRAAKPDARPAPKPAPRPVTPQSGSMEGMDHSAHDMSQMPPASDQAKPAEPMPGMDMQDHSQHGAAPQAEHGGMAMTGTALPAGDAPAPPPPMDHFADRQFPKDEMARARERMMREQGGQTFYQVMFNLAEYRARQGRDGYHWDGEAFVGGDINRLWLKSEGEGSFGEPLESAEVQALYSHAVGPYFNLQAGVRQDFGRGPDRTYATVGFEGLAPYMFEVEGALFLSTKGDLLGRLEGYYDQRITQRLILQPRVELNLAAQDVPENRIGAGLTDAELGLRLRYDISRRFAPYVGVSWEAKTGRTADFARADGEDPTTTSLVAGVRIWF
ncbi:copper resistance protein B [Sphingomonas sp. LM7]|jgi:copper resistance protein B|uniref:copper resistance protein B n=1 Tax=Sphingomonas sp. LM7 TaxID=1938607 RepID=UPI000983B5A9|nr:copper resistance protein B [Sphingomonas sp. LM7]AQR75114.1 copper resistance protein CopB [Sphingomonas sp. LM7]